MNITNLLSTPVTHDEINTQAYFIWEQEGRPVGRELEFWLRAEKQIRTQKGSQTEPLTASSARSPVLAATPKSVEGQTPRVTAKRTAKKESTKPTTRRSPRQAKKG